MGVRIVRLHEGDKVAAVGRVPAEEIEDEEVDGEGSPPPESTTPEPGESAEGEIAPDVEEEETLDEEGDVEKTGRDDEKEPPG
jgi:hypothetical protein